MKNESIISLACIIAIMSGGPLQASTPNFQEMRERCLSESSDEIVSTRSLATQEDPLIKEDVNQVVSKSGELDSSEEIIKKFSDNPYLTLDECQCKALCKALYEALERENAKQTLSELYQKLVKEVSGPPNLEVIKAMKEKENFFKINFITAYWSGLKSASALYTTGSSEDKCTHWSTTIVSSEQIIEIAKAQKMYGGGEHDKYTETKKLPVFMFDYTPPKGKRFPLTVYGLFYLALKDDASLTPNAADIIRWMLLETIKDNIILSITNKNQ
jgi:hypothetical protein